MTAPTDQSLVDNLFDVIATFTGLWKTSPEAFTDFSTDILNDHVGNGTSSEEAILLLIAIHRAPPLGIEYSTDPWMRHQGDLYSLWQNGKIALDIEDLGRWSRHLTTMPITRFNCRFSDEVLHQLIASVSDKIRLVESRTHVLQPA
jgi:hypothetical protein